jgi:glutaredoxin
MDDSVFTFEDGPKKEKEITVYSLSTCAFCKQAMDYLKDKGYAFKHVEIDTLDPPKRREIKNELKEQYGKVRIFPFTVIDGGTALKGFNKEEWEEALGA